MRNRVVISAGQRQVGKTRSLLEEYDTSMPQPRDPNDTTCEMFTNEPQLLLEPNRANRRSKNKNQKINQFTEYIRRISK